MIAIDRSAIEIRSPAVSSMSSSRGCGCCEISAGEAEQLVGGVAHRRDDDADLVSPSRSRLDTLGHAPDALGIADRRAAVLLDDQCHGRETYRPEGRAHGTEKLQDPLDDGLELGRLAADVHEAEMSRALIPARRGTNEVKKCEVILA